MLTDNPLKRFSLSGQGNSLTENAVKQEPLLGDICLKGEITVWYAPPNTGKTLIALALMTDAVTNKRIQPDDVFYVNADDSQAGIASKVKVLDDFGIHTLVPRREGFELKELLPAMDAMVAEGIAGGKLIVVDTVKKFTDIMNKQMMRTFGLKVRPFTMAGGTVLLLAHTNKKRSLGGQLVHAGTNDLLEDADSAYMLDQTSGRAASGERIIQFACIKNRGPNLEEVYYRYDAKPELDYLQRLLSVQLEDEYGADRFKQDSPEEAIV